MFYIWLGYLYTLFKLVYTNVQGMGVVESTVKPVF